MINGKRVLALIPARAGSKGIKDKNIIALGGKPLITYTIEAARKSKYIDRVIVSTDGKLIADVALCAGADVPFMRPYKYATDNAKTIDVVLHAISWLDANASHYDILVLLQPTQPLRTADDIDGALEKFGKENERPLVSVCEVDDNPVLIRTIDSRGELNNLLDIGSTIRRQDMPKFYKVNGAIYINKVDEINSYTSFNDNIIPYIMDKNHSVDIDDLNDLENAERIIGREYNEVLY